MTNLDALSGAPQANSGDVAREAVYPLRPEVLATSATEDRAPRQAAYPAPPEVLATSATGTATSATDEGDLGGAG